MKRRSTWFVLVVTLAYWAWESHAEGNIRVDLLLIYPLLSAIYVIALWKKFRWWSLGIAALFMAANTAFFVYAPVWFDKHPG